MVLSFGSLSNVLSVLTIPLWGSSRNLDLHRVVTNKTTLAYYKFSGKWSHFIYPSYLYVFAALSSFPGSFSFLLVFFLHWLSFSSLKVAHSLLSSKTLPIHPSPSSTALSSPHRISVSSVTTPFLVFSSIGFVTVIVHYVKLLFG